MHEGHEPEVVADLGDPDVLSGKHVTEVDLAAVEADAATVRDREGRVS